MSTNPLRSRGGMTLIEVLVALVVGLMVLQVALSFFGQQGRAFARGTTAMNATQNGRSAVNALETDVRTVGTHVAFKQPFMVYAGPDVIAFNADYASPDPLEENAVYVDRDLPPGQSEAVKRLQRFAIPMTGFSYPDSNYFAGTSNSPAETLSLFLQPDASTPRADDYVLMRQVNAAAPAVVARNLLKTGSAPFFEYFVIRVPEDGPTQMVSIGGGPLAHTAPLHGSAQDAGAEIDNIRAVRVRFTVTNGLTGAQEQRRAFDRTIRMPNAGVATRNVCGEIPQGVAPGAQVVLLPSGARGVQLTWTASVDEHAGEGDVLRYILWKRTLPADFTDPWMSIPAGLNGYTYVDENVARGTTVQYAVAAQDCTPSRSAQALSLPVAIPNF
ncbi:PilW family protein [Longimicrobium sp.]|uniref:PilW family protein n=1 Tax=Longimicrobium sp. TaxID=2029185 RepID=UPI002E3756F7|nr:prepilin-type N-terminal cleavage/methylation domain-containing protein [Longimicrobium sp.]HEX6037273.1 prepilin-type N-terminal cleavage/methylation domain-containing protein [Longimicrobium sp.]